MDLLCQELSDFTERWNRHLLAPSEDAILPRGRPITFYHHSESFDSASWLIPVSSEYFCQEFLNNWRIPRSAGEI